MLTAGQQIVEGLKANGVDRVFCVPGESFLPLLEGLRICEIDTITARHESSAGFMALADGRMTGRPGICMVSRGPGATNVSIAVHSAQQDGLPLILFIGQAERQHVGRDSFQEIDYSKMFGDIAKWVYELTDASRVPEVIARAFTIAMSGSPGPVVISLPEDVLEVRSPEVLIKASIVPSSAPTRQSMDKIMSMLAMAKKPLLIAGGDFGSDAERKALRLAAEKHRVPVIEGFRRHSVFPCDHPLYAGNIGTGTTSAQGVLLEQADLLLYVGTRMSDWGTLGYTFPTPPWPSQPLVHVCADTEAIGKNFQPDVGIVCRGPAFIEILLERDFDSTGIDRTDWIKCLNQQALKQEIWTTIEATDGVPFGNVIEALGRLAPDATSIVPDAGISAALVYKYFPFKGRRKLYSTMSGVMGYGVPAAVSIAMREPERKIVCLVGDGGFMMTGNELAIAVERKLPIKIFLSNNRSLGTIRIHQEKHYPGTPHATDLSGPDFLMLAESFGCRAMTIKRNQDIDATVKAALETEDPVLVEVMSSLQAILPK